MIDFKMKGMVKVNLEWWKPTQRQWAPVLNQDQRPFWQRETDPTTGRPWASLSSSYEILKQKRWPGAPILRASGKMQDGLKIKPENEGFSAASTKYGVYHQFGTMKMVARPWVGVPDTSLEKLPPIAWKNILSTRKS